MRAKTAGMFSVSVFLLACKNALNYYYVYVLGQKWPELVFLFILILYEYCCQRVFITVHFILFYKDYILFFYCISWNLFRIQLLVNRNKENGKKTILSFEVSLHWCNWWSVLGKKWRERGEINRGKDHVIERFFLYNQIFCEKHFQKQGTLGPLWGPKLL